MRTKSYGDVSVLGALVSMAAMWALFFIAIGFMARSAVWLFCLGYGCS